LEAKIVTLRKHLQNKNMQNNSKCLEDIISIQRPNHDKSILEYNRIEKGLRSKTTDQETHPRSYVETVRGDKKFYNQDHIDTPPPTRFKF
jgi:hypothetical protein